MGQRPCCRSCRHCVPPNGAEFGWCQLRQLPIHPELTLELCCHHWTPWAPRLPAISVEAVAVGSPAQSNHQLSFEAAFGKI